METSRNKFWREYNNLVTDIMTVGVDQHNERTSTIVRVLPGGVSFKIDMSSDILPIINLRKVYPHIAAAEVSWFLSGKRDVRPLSRYTKIWDKFTVENTYTIKNAYGYRWREHFYRDQILDSISALMQDSSTRQVYISTWDPANDGLLNNQEKNIPCPVGFTLSILQGKLHSSLMMRSSDVFVGLPYDIMGHAILMKTFAESIGIGMGSMHITLAHAHIYDCHWEQATIALELQNTPLQVSIPQIFMLKDWDITKASRDMSEFVRQYKMQDKTDPDLYNPKVEVVL